MFSGLPSVPTFVESKGVSLSPLPENATYHFITEVFFLCQQAINQGFFIVSKLIKLNRSLANLHKLYKDIVTNGSKEVVSAIKDQINKGKDQIYVLYMIYTKCSKISNTFLVLFLKYNLSNPGWNSQNACLYRPFCYLMMAMTTLHIYGKIVAFSWPKKDISK